MKVGALIRLLEENTWARRGVPAGTLYVVVIERGDTSWGAHVPDLPGRIAVGETRAGLRRLIREAIELRVIELRVDEVKRDGLPVPAPSSEGEIVEVGAA